jgi:hypothetical protein
MVGEPPKTVTARRHKMKQAVEVEEVDDIPVSAILKVQRPSRYGTIADLDEEELADPDELEHQIFLQEWGPVLALPVRRSGRWIQPNIDENGHADFGAFATVDFERMQPEFDKAKYKVDKLKEDLSHMIIRMETINARIPGRTKYKVLKYLRQGRIDLDDIEHEDMRALGKLYLCALRVKEEISQIKKASWERRQRKAQAWLAEH